MIGWWDDGMKLLADLGYVRCTGAIIVVDSYANKSSNVTVFWMRPLYSL